MCITIEKGVVSEKFGDAKSKVDSTVSCAWILTSFVRARETP